MADDGKNPFVAWIDVSNKRPGNMFSISNAGTSLNNTWGVFGVVDHAHRMLPAITGGLLAKRIYTWGVAVFRKKDDEEKKFWHLAKTDEGAGSLALWIFTFLLMRFLPGSTTERFCCGLIGRGSIVVYNTIMRWIGQEKRVRANETTDAGMIEAIDITSRAMSQIDIQPANEAPAPEQLDEELIREVGGLALKSPEFRTKVSDGLARRLNDFLNSQGRAQIEDEQIHRQVADLFQSMASR